MKSGACLLATMAVLGLSQGASADQPTLKPFSLRLEVPADSSGCGDRTTSAGMGGSFSNQTGLTVTGANCVGSNTVTENGSTYKTDIVVVNYMAENEAVPVNSIFGGSAFEGVTSSFAPLFSTYADCLNARKSQEANFATQTKLPVFVSYCAAPESVGDHGYSLVVMGFGTPDRKLFAFMQDNAAMGDLDPRVLAAVQNAIVQQDGYVVYSDANRVFFYAPYNLAVTVGNMGSFEVPAQCEQQIAQASTIYNADNLLGVKALCVPIAPQSTEVELTVVGGGSSSLTEDYGYPSAKYATFEDCMSDESRVLQNAASSGRGVIGAICERSMSDNGFSLHLFSNMQ
jgi:hypothetical protein